MTHPAPNWWMFWLLIPGILLVFYPPFALAIGDDVSVGTFACVGGAANGKLYLPGDACPTTLSFDNVFSFLVCNMQQLASNVLGQMYCGLIFKLAPAVWALITLAVLIFGISFTIGTTAATGAEAIAFLLKIGFVAAFATNADYIIGYAYQFFIGGMSTGVTVVLNGMGVTNASTGAEAFKLLDNFFKQILDYAVGGSGSPIGEEKCKNALFAVLATMGMAFPLVAYFSLALIAKIFLAIFRAIFGYIYAIFGVTFLIILSPIFVSFQLFKPTQSYFNKWLGYMVSMMIQVVLLFAFLTFILSLPISKMTDNLSTLIMYQEQAPENTSFRLPWQYCTLCDFEVVDRNNTSLVITDKDDNYIERAKLQCKTPKEAITITFAIAPKQEGKMNALLSFLGNGIFSLIVLAIVVERLLGMVPMLAQRLGMGLGGGYAPQMGGGTGLVAPGESLARDFGQGFKRSMEDNAYMYRDMKGKTVNIVGGRVAGGDGITGTIVGVADGFKSMVTGRYAQNENASSTNLYNVNTEEGQKAQQKAGLVNWRRWISNPHDFGK